jgi:methionyl aminopeptidase
VDVTYQALWQGIYQVKPGARLGDIAAAVQQYAEKHGYSVVREYCGHGIGREMHEEPQILHYGKAGTGLTLKPGMVFTIEPMINQGDRRVKQKSDGWTVVTKDKKLSAQWEHTVAVTDTGFLVLTLRPEEQNLVQVGQTTRLPGVCHSPKRGRFSCATAVGAGAYQAGNDQPRFSEASCIAVATTSRAFRYSGE